MAGDGDGAGLQPRRAVSAPLPPPQLPPPHRRLGPSRSAGPLGIMALEQLCSVLKGKRPGPRTAPPAGKTGLFAFLPGAGRPTRPFVWHERTAAPGSRRDPLCSPSASSQPSVCALAGDPGSASGLGGPAGPASCALALLPRICHTSLCKVVGFV